MQNGILIGYEDQTGLFSVNKYGDKSVDDTVICCLPCLNKKQESTIYRYLLKNGSHNYLINLTAHHSVKAGLLSKFS